MKFQRSAREEGGSDQSLRNTASQQSGLAGAFCHDVSEHLNHTEYSTEQTHQGRNGRDGTQGIQVTFHFMDFVGSHFLNTFFHDLTAVAGVDQTSSQDTAQRAAFTETADTV